MITNQYPFDSARSDDKLYIYIKNNNFNEYWSQVRFMRNIPETV